MGVAYIEGEYHLIKTTSNNSKIQLLSSKTVDFATYTERVPHDIKFLTSNALYAYAGPYTYANGLHMFAYALGLDFRICVAAISNPDTILMYDTGIRGSIDRMWTYIGANDEWCFAGVGQAMAKQAFGTITLPEISLADTAYTYIKAKE